MLIGRNRTGVLMWSGLIAAYRDASGLGKFGVVVPHQDLQVSSSVQLDNGGGGGGKLVRVVNKIKKKKQKLTAAWGLPYCCLIAL